MIAPGIGNVPEFEEFLETFHIEPEDIEGVSDERLEEMFKNARVHRLNCDNDVLCSVYRMSEKTVRDELIHNRGYSPMEVMDLEPDYR